jgi:hypothetical protein
MDRRKRKNGIAGNSETAPSHAYPRAVYFSALKTETANSPEMLMFI